MAEIRKYITAMTLAIAGVVAANELVFSSDTELSDARVISGAETFEVVSGVRVICSGRLSGSGSLRLTGGGTLVLSGANTYSGGTMIDAGFLCVSNNTALGTGPVTILGQRRDYTGACELDIMGAGSNDVSTLTLANPISIVGDTTPEFPALMVFGQNSALTGKITAAKDFYFYDDVQSTKRIWTSQFNRYLNVTALTFGEIDCAGTLGNRGFAKFVFGGKVKAPLFDLTFTRPIQRTGDDAIGSNAHSSFVFTTPSEIGEIRTHSHHVMCTATNVLPGTVLNMTSLPSGYEGSCYFYLYNYNASSTSYDQSLAALVSDACHDDLTPKFGWGVQGSGGHTLTLTGLPAPATEATGSIRLYGKMNLVLDAPDGYTQTLLNRSHTLSGAITVKKGTLRLAGLCTFSNATAVTVQTGGVLKVEVADTNVLKNAALSLEAGAALYAPENGTLRVKSYTVAGVKKGPGFYYADPATPLKSGIVICLDGNGRIPACGGITGGGTVTEPFAVNGNQEWRLAAGERLIVDGSLRMLEGRVSVVAPNAAAANRAQVAFRGTNMMDGAFVNTAAVVTVSGLLATPNHADQGTATRNGAKTLTIDGYPGGGQLFVSNAVIEKPVYLHGSGFGVLQSAAATTNVLKGHVAWPTPWPGFTAAAGSEIVFAGGFTSGHTLRTNGEGTFRVRGSPVDATASVGWNIAAGKVALDVAANKFSYLCTGHQNGSVAALDFGVSEAFDLTANAALLNGFYWDDGYSAFRPLTVGSGTIDLGGTCQRVNKLVGGPLSTIRGEPGAMIEIFDQTPDSKIKESELFLASRLEGAVSLKLKGAGTLLLTNRVFETTGDLEATAGTIEIAPNAAWHGTGGVTLRGSARLKLNAADQLAPDTHLELYDTATVEIPAGATLTVKTVDVWDGAGWIHYTASGTHAASDGDLLAGRLRGGGRLVLTGADVAFVPRASFPLEWSSARAGGENYEVEIDVARLRDRVELPENPAFEVEALVDGQRRALGVSLFAGRRPGRVALRFNVPTGTTALTARVGAGPAPQEDATVTDNLFVDALSSAAVWSLDATLTRENRASGIAFSASGTATGRYARYTVAVPEEWRGKGVRLEIDVTSESVLPWGGFIRLWQYDAAGNRLPESVSDVRWTSHIRPPGKFTPYRENGRIHPDAATVAAVFEIRGNTTSYDNYGLPLANAEDAKAHLLVTRLVLRRAEELPFPKYDDAFFPAGVTGAADDTALRLGGDDHNGFFYATHSSAVWSEAYDSRDERQNFFPAGDGTVEAWFKPDAWPSAETYLFCGFQGYSAQKSASGRGALMYLRYLDSKHRLTFCLKDRTNGVYSATATCAIPLNEWSHLAAQWSTNGTATVFLNGTPVITRSIAGFKCVDLAAETYPDEEMVTEFFLGSHSANARNVDTAEDASYPFFQGAVDNLRVSTGARYADAFTPATAFAVDDATRALFAFNRQFDGVSGGGARFIRGSIRSFADRVQHALALTDSQTGGATSAAYWPDAILPENDHRLVLDIDNYPVLPTVAEFHAARRATNAVFRVAPGDAFTLDLPGTVYADYVEIANDGDEPLVHPFVCNAGEIDPRSFGDIRDTLGLSALDDRACANKVFQFVLGASDYFMNHTAFFTPGTDTPGDVEYEALTMLNGYCGFECGPLNSMTKNIFACSGGLPATQTGGYGHSFEEVFYDGKNHIYDLSAQKFFPAMDNETAAYLEEAADQPGLFHRIGANPDHFIRKARRSADASSPSYRAKVAMTLNPGERLRLWFDNDGEVNDLQCAKSQVHETTDQELHKENYDAVCPAVAGNYGSIYRIHRFFPHYGNGFLVYEGAADAANPAFAQSSGSFTIYAVQSCYPIVAGDYTARLRTGATAPLAISTDRGKTWRDLPTGKVRYPVRARTEYLVRAAAKPADIARFTAVTEVQVNSRILNGRLHGGANALSFKATRGGTARVTLGWREPARPIVVSGGVYAGTIPGAEQQLVALEPGETRTFAVEGTSAAAVAHPYGGLSATLAGGVLTVTAPGAMRGFGWVTLADGTAEKTLTVLVAPGVRLLTPDQGLAPGGTTTTLAADEGRVQKCLNFTSSASTATGSFASLPAGRYVVLGLDRYESHPPALGTAGLSVTLPNAGGAVSLSYPANGAVHYLKAHYGRAGGRASFKWGHPRGPGNDYYTAQMKVFDVPAAFSSLTIEGANTWTNGIELAAVLVVPCDNAGETEELYCDLVKMLCGLNCQPHRVASGAADASGGEAFRLWPTFVNCGVVWKHADELPDAVVECRVAGSAAAWSRAPRLRYFADVGEYRGSILDLAEDTAYEARIATDGGRTVWATGGFRTWKSDVPVARTVTLDPETTVFPITIAEKGTPEGWIRYTLPPGTALTNASSSATTFVVQGASHVLFDDMRLVGGARYVFQITDSTGVRIRNCDLSGWGRTGTPRYDVVEGGKRYATPADRNAINYDCAIYIGAGARETVVERCYAHDPRGRANSWYYSHPAGPEAVMMYSPDHSTVLRWNDFCGGVEHRFNDVVEGYNNFHPTGGFNREADVYGNYMGFSNDDAIELDGGMNNVRCFDNRFEYNYCGVSIQGCMKSPVYVYRNAFTGMCDEFDLYGQTVKTSTNTTGVDAVSYVWDNLLWGGGTGIEIPNGAVYDWTLEVTGNVFSAGQKLTKVERATAESVTAPNVLAAAVGEAQLDVTRPVRPLPFVLERVRFSGVRVAAGEASMLPAGQIDVGRAVFRYAGQAGATSHWPIVSSTAVADSTNAVATFDLRADLVQAAGLSTGPLPFAKTGPGALVLAGESDAARFAVGADQPGSGYPQPTGLSNRFVLPADGTMPTEGFAFFSLLEGALVLERGTLQTLASNGRMFIGGWTAAAGEVEKDVAFIVNGGVVDNNNTVFVGQRHGLANVNTPDGPARAELTINGGEFRQNAGKSFTLGSGASAPNGGVFNGEVALTVNPGGVFAQAGGSFYVPQYRGQRSWLTVNGGRFQTYCNIWGNNGTADDGTAAFDVAVTNGGAFLAACITNNFGNRANSPPVTVTVADGGTLQVDDFQNRGAGRLDLRVDGGTLGNANFGKGGFGARRQIVGPGFASFTVGPGGLVVRARCAADGTPVTCVIASPITSCAGPICVEADPGCTVEFAAGGVFSAPLTVTGGRVAIPSGMTVTMADLTGCEALDLAGTLVASPAAGETATLACAVTGSGRLVKTGAGTLRVTGKVAADVLEAQEGTTVVASAFNAIRLVRFARGIVRLEADEALSRAALEWTDPTAALETCAYLDLNGHANTNGVMTSVRPAAADGHFWVKNAGGSVTWTVVNEVPGTNVVWLGLDAKVNFNSKRVSVPFTRGVQVLSNLLARANATFACEGYVVAGEAHFPNMKTLTFNSGAMTTFDLSNPNLDVFPALTKIIIDSHTVTLNERALAAFNVRKRHLSLQTNLVSSFVLPEGGVWRVATWIERNVSPNVNHAKGVYGPSEYGAGYPNRSLKPASARLKVLSSGPGAVELPDEMNFRLILQ